MKFRFPQPKSRSQSKVKYLLLTFFFTISQKQLIKVNLIKFNTMVKHNEKVCQAQNLGSHDQGQGHNYRFTPNKSCIHNNSERVKQI